MFQRIAEKALDLTYAAITGKPDYCRHYSKIRGKESRLLREGEPDLVLIGPPTTKPSWILGAICNEIASMHPGCTAIVPFGEPLPMARAYFFSHYGYFRDCLRKQPEIGSQRVVLFYTHPRELWFSEEELLYSFQFADHVVSMSSVFLDHLKTLGVANSILALTGADPDFFYPHTRGSGKAGFCSAYYPRKNGSLILDIVKSMPDVQFLLCGRQWNEWRRFGELRELTNFEYLEIPYSQYPDFYADLDVFISTSELEGGPIPLIEAMMCNVVPVATRTGHATDIVKHGTNGFLFDPKDPLDQVCALVQSAFSLNGDVRKSVEHLTWKRFSSQVLDLAGLETA